MDEAVELLGGWMDEEQAGCRFVVTPNLDHVLRIQHDDALRAAYGEAALVIADGWPLVTASRWFGCPLPERVAGSDLVPRLFAAARSQRPRSVFLLGAEEGVAEVAARQIAIRWPHVRVAGTFSPPFGFGATDPVNEEILQRLAAAAPDLLVVGLGSPRQEIWLQQFRSRLQCRVAVAAGATIDFLAGQQTRAPCWVQAVRMEWLFRALSDPGRLGRRYARNLFALPGLLVRERRARRRKT